MKSPASVSAHFPTRSVFAANPQDQPPRMCTSTVPQDRRSCGCLPRWRSASSYPACSPVSTQRARPRTTRSSPACCSSTKPRPTSTAPASPTLSIRIGKTSPQRFFQDLAFYRISREKADADPTSNPWNIAYSSTNLFPLLGLPILYADRPDPHDATPAQRALAGSQPRSLDALLCRRPAHCRPHRPHRLNQGENRGRRSCKQLAAARRSRRLDARVERAASI